ncbi:MAG: hypothetical protein WDO74_33720 [Pseudomonadota bacterium]
MENTSLRLVGRAATAVLEQLTTGLGDGNSRAFDEPTHTHMALEVRRLTSDPAGSLFSIGHYHAQQVGQNRSVLADPEVLFVRFAHGSWLPLSLCTPFEHVVTVDLRRVPRILRPAEHARLVRLVDDWMLNVARAGLLPIAEPISEHQQMWSRSASAAVSSKLRDALA